MSSANKAKGSLWERQVEDHLNESGLKARRLPRAGSKDIGDVAIELNNNIVIIIEAKNTKVANLMQYLREADIEAGNYEDKYNKTTIGVVAQKTRQKSTGDGRITMTIDNLINLLNWCGLT